MKWRLFPKRRFHNKASFRSILTTSIDLLRHGVTENSQRYCGSTNYPLTALGWTQMWHTVNSQSTQWQHIVTSPLARCADFAHAMEQHHSIPVTQDDRIREIHFGDWEDRSSAELMHTDADALSRFWQNPFDYPPPNGEHLLDFEARVLSAWEDIQQKFHGKKVLLITHGGVIRMIVCHILQHPLKRVLDIDVRHASIRHVEIDHTKACHVRLDPNSSL